MSDAQRRLQILSEEYQKLQQGIQHRPPEISLAFSSTTSLTHQFADLQTNIEARQKLESQQQENQSVQKAHSPTYIEAMQGLTKTPAGVLQPPFRCQHL